MIDFLLDALIPLLTAIAAYAAYVEIVRGV